MNTIKSDIEFVKGILPDHYTVEESKKEGSIHCYSRTGIFIKPDAEDNEHWGYVMEAFKGHFGERFQEVYHNTCTNHIDFTIYLKLHITDQPLPDGGKIVDWDAIEKEIRAIINPTEGQFSESEKIKFIFNFIKSRPEFQQGGFRRELSVEEQIKVIEEATEKASTSKESAIKFLKDAGILKNKNHE